MTKPFRTALLVVLGLGSSVHALQERTGEPSSPETMPVIRALLRDVIFPARDRLFPATPSRLFAFTDETLAACASVPPLSPCILDDTFNRARLEAAKGRWPLSLAIALESENRRPQSLAWVEHGGLIVGRRAELRPNYGKWPPLAISAPAFVENQALVYVQFAQRYTYFVLLSRGEGGWKVTSTFIINAS